MDAVAVETFVPNLHVGAKRVDGGKILNREADRFRRRGEATITESLRTAFASVTCQPRGWSGWKADIINHTTAIFQQINKHKQLTHHDALEFPDGQIVCLTELFEGQEATVLQLPAQPATAAKAKAQERVAHVG
jgi:hypothetical protein